MLTGRTDLAVEAAVSREMEGIVRSEETVDGVPVTVVEVRTREAAERVGKPVGRYVTLELGPVRRRETEAFRRSVLALAGEIARMLPPEPGPVLVACLGNRAVTPDAIGPLTHDHLLVTRHLVESVPEHFGGFRPVAAVATGVLGTTGVESGDLIGAVARRVEPVCVIAVDALAARGLERLCATVQLSDGGIAPGSGVGNCRKALDRESLGTPVIALGVPTVVDASTLALDLLAEAGQEGLDPETLGGKGSELFVTPRDIDVRVAECAKLIAYAINLALQPELTLEDLEALVE